VKQYSTDIVQFVKEIGHGYEESTGNLPVGGLVQTAVSLAKIGHCTSFYPACSLELYRNDSARNNIF
jgi:hypothetical protein